MFVCIKEGGGGGRGTGICLVGGFGFVFDKHEGEKEKISKKGGYIIRNFCFRNESQLT